MRSVFYFALSSIILCFSSVIQAGDDFLAVVHYPKKPVSMGKHYLLSVTVKSSKTWQQGHVTLTDNALSEASHSEPTVISSTSLPKNRSTSSYYLPTTVLYSGITHIKGEAKVQWAKSDHQVAYPVIGFGICALDGHAFFGRNADDAVSQMAQYNLKQANAELADLFQKNQAGTLSSMEWQSLYNAFDVERHQLMNRLLDKDTTAFQYEGTESSSDLANVDSQTYRYLPLYFETAYKAEVNTPLPHYVYKARTSGTVTAIVNTNGYFVPDMSVNNEGEATYVDGNDYMIQFAAQAGESYVITIVKPTFATGLFSIELYAN